MSRSLRQHFEALEREVTLQVDPPHPGEIIVEARRRQRPSSRPSAAVALAGRLVGYAVAGAAATAMLWALFAVLVPEPAPDAAPPAAPVSTPSAPSWATPPTAGRSPTPSTQAAVPAPSVAAPAPAPAPPGEVEVTVWFQSEDRGQDGCRLPARTTRFVAADEPVLGAVVAVLAGPTEAERRAGLQSAYTGTGAALERRVARGSNEVVVVDLTSLTQVATEEPPGCRSADLRGPVENTLTDLQGVVGPPEGGRRELVFLVQGSAEAFQAYVDDGGPATP